MSPGPGRCDCSARRRAARWREYVTDVTEIVADGRPDDALARFMGLAGMGEAGLATMTDPVLVIIGDQGSDFFGPAASALTAILPASELRELSGQGHVADPRMLAAEVRRLLRS